MDTKKAVNLIDQTLLVLIYLLCILSILMFLSQIFHDVAERFMEWLWFSESEKVLSMPRRIEKIGLPSADGTLNNVSVQGDFGKLLVPSLNAVSACVSFTFWIKEDKPFFGKSHSGFQSLSKTLLLFAFLSVQTAGANGFPVMLAATPTSYESQWDKTEAKNNAAETSLSGTVVSNEINEPEDPFHDKPLTFWHFLPWICIVLLWIWGYRDLRKFLSKDK